MNTVPVDEPRYPIRAVVRRTGIPAATLRSWERRYGFPSPTRTATARRLYSRADLEAIQWLKAQLGTGLSIGQAVQWYRSGHRDEAATVSTERTDRTPHPAAPHGGEAGLSLDAFAQELLAAVAAYDEAALEATLSSAFSVHLPDYVLLDLLVPVLHEIGQRWAAGRLPVTAEHFASNVFRRRLFILLAQQPVSHMGPPIVLACVPGEEHELGLLMLAVFLRWEGLHPLYLGANVPFDDLLHCLQQTEAPAVCLSAVMTASAATLGATTAQVAQARSAVGIFAGGAGCASAPRTTDIQVLGDDLRAAARVIAEAVRTPNAPRVQSAFHSN